jgi:transglutaminase-like putative cysteine protease
MKHKRFFLSCLFSFFIVVLTSAQNYPVSAIPSELKENAFAVVRESSETFVQQDLYNGNYKITYAVTVLNSKGDSFAGFYIYEDSFRELKNFSGEIFNEAGKSIKKIAKKDLTTTALSASLATDGKHSFYNLYTPSYPFTVKYSYEVKYKNGVLMYPTFAPVSAFHLSVEKADYLLQIPEDCELRVKKISTDMEAVQSLVKQNKSYQWSISHFSALPAEPFAPVNELFPVIYLSPEKFCVENACGSMFDWATFGQWLNGLLKGRNLLPQKTIDKALELTRDLPQTRDKVKALYEYLQNTTHYVNIQLGIGGWQPMRAEEVAKTGFGDCKALSNYMKALLDVIEIPSYYVIISTEKKRFFPDYPNFTQANHVVLMVPAEKDTLWLECTSQTLPFGYIHKNILGHDALAIGDKDAFFCTLPSYPPLDNVEINSIDVNLSPDGHAEFKVHSTYKMDIFERMFYKLSGLNAREESEVLGNLLKIHKPQISEVRKEETLSESPEMNLYYTVKCEEYASKTGSRMFFPVNPAYTSLKGLLSGNTRRYDMIMNSSLCETDSIRLHIPENYELETKPKPVEISSDYGSFKVTIEEQDGIILYIQKLELVPGRYPASEFEKMKTFFNTIENLQTAKMGLKKAL